MASHPATRTTCLPRQLANSPALARHAHQYLAEAGFEPALVARCKTGAKMPVTDKQTSSAFTSGKVSDNGLISSVIGSRDGIACSGCQTVNGESIRQSNPEALPFASVSLAVRHNQTR